MIVTVLLLVATTWYWSSSFGSRFVNMFRSFPLLLSVASVLAAPRHPDAHARRQSASSGFAVGDLGTLAGIPGVSATYDYVVVGGGTAGIPLAVRLAESGASVALIEAGEYLVIGSTTPETTPNADVQNVGSDPSQIDPEDDWGFIAYNQPGVNNRPIHYARGKVLGGSSMLNFMIYQRGTTESFQKWADLVGDQSYTFENVLPYYKKSPQVTAPNTALRAANASAEYSALAFDTAGGPLQVSFPSYAQSFSSWLEVGLNAVGIEDAADFNSGSLLGAQYPTTTIDPSSETRSSSSWSFLTSAVNANLSNLHVYSGTIAQKVNFNSSKAATGVEVQGNGTTYTLNATNEVILSAGVFQSPQLLMLSGIGPKSTLEDLGITVVSELPGVGQNMWDHIFFGPSYPVAVDTLTKLVRDSAYATSEYIKYVVSRTGVFTNQVCDYLGWEKVPDSDRSGFSGDTTTALSQFPSDWPEVEYLSSPGFVGNFSNLASQPLDGNNYATIMGGLVAPLSRGNVTITSTNASVLPTINPNWLSSTADQEVAVATFKRLRQIWNTTAMASVISGAEYYPGTDVVSTDAEILEWIKNNMMTLWHAACTCKMGNSSDPDAVIDSSAKVYGVSGLRVVDASSFPILVPGHPQSTVYMLAEKIAASIISGSS